SSSPGRCDGGEETGNLFNKKPAGLLRQVMAHAEENVVVMTNFLSDFNASIQFEITEPELQYML
ncbi:hypothetical protein, partial [Escherichia coli]|uniref:hypothetical protein n=1 Tax=Escherichia coli TaxID=562 RepID=UPI0039A61660